MSDEEDRTKEKSAMPEQKSASEKPKPAKTEAQESHTFHDWAAI